jgi:hypothetical protein
MLPASLTNQFFYQRQRNCFGALSVRASTSEGLYFWNHNAAYALSSNGNECLGWWNVDWCTQTTPNDQRKISLIDWKVFVHMPSNDDELAWSKWKWVWNFFRVRGWDYAVNWLYIKSSANRSWRTCTGFDSRAKS